MHPNIYIYIYIIIIIIISFLPSGRSFAQRLSIPVYPLLLMLPNDSFFFLPAFISTSLSSSIILILGLPYGLLPNILPSSTSLNSPSPLNIQFFFLSLIVVIKHLFSFTFVSTSSLLILSCHLIFSNFLHSHISSAFNLFISSFLNVHVWQPYNTTGHTNTFIILICSVLLSPPFVKNSFLLLNASFESGILVFTSTRLYPSSDILDPRYLKFLTCSTF